MANQDPHAKQLLIGYPRDTLELFAPELLQAHGNVTSAEEVSTEVFNLDPQGRSGFLDVAINYTFADGSECIILLVEHWSSARSVNLRRTARYLTELLWRHPHAQVLPILLITDANPSRQGPPNDRLVYEIAGKPILDIHFRVFSVDHEWRQRVNVQHNVVGAVLWVVPEFAPAVDRCLQAISTVCAMDRPWNKGSLGALIAHMEQFAKLTPEQAAQLHRRIQGDHTMPSMLVELFKAEGKAEGLAKGKAEGEIHALLSLVADGDLSVEKARSRLARWLAEGDLTQAQHDGALAKLPA